jgi:hypothetical protein
MGALAGLALVALPGDLRSVQSRRNAKPASLTQSSLPEWLQFALGHLRDRLGDQQGFHFGRPVEVLRLSPRIDINNLPAIGVLDPVGPRFRVQYLPRPLEGLEKLVPFVAEDLVNKGRISKVD